MIIEEPKKILIMKFRNIGDVLLTTPLIKNLKLNYPNALIDVAINKGCEDMLTLNPSINDIIIYDRSKIKKLNFFGKIKEESKFAFNLRKNNYDLVINTTKGDRGIFLSLITGAKYKIGYSSKNKVLNFSFTHILPLTGMNHMVDVGLDVLRVIDKPIKEKKVELFVDKSDIDSVNDLLSKNDINNKNFIHIHPVSRWMFKCINDITMAKIIDYCENILKIKVIITASPDRIEKEKVESIISLCNSNPINFSGEVSLKEVAVLNKKSILFIGVDTAIMHMSAANNVPVISFFGPSAAFHWGPWDNDLFDNKYINRNGNQRMGNHYVFQKSMECVPCDKDGCNGTKISDCLMSFNIDEIIKEIDSRLDND